MLHHLETRLANRWVEAIPSENPLAGSLIQRSSNLAQSCVCFLFCYYSSRGIEFFQYLISLYNYTLWFCVLAESCTFRVITGDLKFAFNHFPAKNRQNQVNKNHKILGDKSSLFVWAPSDKRKTQKLFWGYSCMSSAGPVWSDGDNKMKHRAKKIAEIIVVLHLSVTEEKINIQVNSVNICAGLYNLYCK